MAFSLGALVLCLAVAGIAYFSARSTIAAQAIQTAEATALTNARTLQTVTPDASGLNILKNLTSFDSADGSLSLYEFSSNWLVASPYTNPTPTTSFSKFDLPESLVALVTSGVAAEQVFSFDGAQYIGVGYLVGGNGFFQVFPTTSTSRTLGDLGIALLFATIVTTLAGAVLGRWAAKRVLRPLHNATLAASAIAAGQLDTRLETDDTSDLSALASAFNTMVDGVQNRIEREARFASDVAHELRSPLTTLATSASVLESRRDELPERSKQALDLLASEIQRFQRMVFDLLEISRLDAGVANLTLSVVTTGDLVRNALASAGASDVPLAMDASTAEIFLNVDKRRFERIITNLVTNASRHGGGATRVEVTRGDDIIRIAVEDHGPGVPPDERSRIFERFARGAVTAGQRGSGSGSGLGLALVTEHLKLHNGTITVEDAPDGGARFVVEVPIAPPSVFSDEGPFDDDEDSP